MTAPRTWADEDAIEDARSAMRALSRSKQPGDRERLEAARELVHRGYYARALAVALNMPEVGISSRGPSLASPQPTGFSDLDPYIPA
jgi:hypothetical protein